MTTQSELNYLRPEVLAFALIMEKELRKHDDRPGWKDDTAHSLIRRIMEETEQLYTSVNFCIDTPEQIASNAADVANMAMMVADVRGGLE